MKELEQALAGNRVIFMGARGAGKTTAAIKWARNHGGRVIFAVTTANMVALTLAKIQCEYQDEIEATSLDASRGVVLFKDDTEIRIVQCQYDRVNALRGLRADALVLDNINHMDEGSVIQLLTSVVHKENFSFFATCVDDKRGGYKLLKGLDKVSPVQTVAVDYLDLIENGRLSAEEARNLMTYMSDSAFRKEMGPYKKDFQLRRNNAFFKHLLKKQ